MLEIFWKDFKEIYKNPKMRVLLLIFIILCIYFSKIVDIKINNKEYLKENGHYYQLSNDNVDWDEAKIRCEKMGGHLATINDELENNIIKSIMGYSAIWLGGFKFQNNWMWVSNEMFRYENWDEGEPNNYAEKENVIVMFPDGVWNDGTKIVYNLDGSTNGLPYVCEWENRINVIINIFNFYWSFGIF